MCENCKKFNDTFWKTNAVKRPDQKWTDRQEKRMIRKVRSIWRKQRAYLLEESKKLSFLKKNSTDAEIDKLLNKLPYKETLAAEIVAFMKLAIKRGGTKIIKELKLGKFGISFDVSNKRAVKFLKEKKEWELSTVAHNIDHTTKEGIKKILVDSVETGASYGATAKKIKDQSKAGVFSLDRAKMIAVRETGVAYEEGKSEVMSDFLKKYPKREVMKKWQTVNDERVTPTHSDNEGEGWVDYNYVYEATGGDLNAPGSDNPRCRCFTRYEIPKA